MLSVCIYIYIAGLLFFCMEMEQRQTLYVAWGSIESPSLDVLGRNLTEQAI